MARDLIPSGYDGLLHDLKVRVQQAQVRAVLSVNRELILLYWQIGREILDRQRAQGWGAKVIDRLATDLRREFPEMKGFSARNLKYMREFAETYPDLSIVQTASAQITWHHNIMLMEKVKDPSERLWYMEHVIEHRHHPVSHAESADRRVYAARHACAAGHRIISVVGRAP